MHDHSSAVAWMLAGHDGRRAHEDRAAIHRADLRASRPSRPSLGRRIVDVVRAAVAPPAHAADPACCPA